MTESHAAISQTIAEGRVLDLRRLQEVRGSETSDVSAAESAFKRVAEKEELIDFLVHYMSQPARYSSEVAAAKARIADLRAEIKAEYDDLIAKLEIQEALKELGLY